MLGRSVLAAVMCAAIVVIHQPVGAEPAAVPGWGPETLAGRTGTWTVTTTYTMPVLTMDQEQAVVERTLVAGDVLQEQVTGTMVQVAYVGEARSGYDAETGRYWTSWSEDGGPAVTLHGTYDHETATYTYQGTVADPMLGDALIQIVWIIDGPDRETVIYSADSSDMGLVEIMRQDYVRAE